MSTPTSNQGPNFIYIGTSKAGSTWLFDVLSRHPDVYMIPTKGLYFFDHHFHQGWQWYLDHFAEARSEKVIAEISHSYLYSQVARDYVAEMNPNIKLMMCLRNPIDRAVSMYLDGVRNGKWNGPLEDRIEDTPEIAEEGCYAEYVANYLECFPREQVHISLFDDLKQDPQKHALRVFDFLGVASMPLEPKLQTKVMPASMPRYDRLCSATKSLSQICRELGWKRFRGRVKRSRLIRNLLYRQLADSERATIRAHAEQLLRDRFRSDVEKLEELIGIPLAQRWGFAEAPQPV